MQWRYARAALFLCVLVYFVQVPVRPCCYDRLTCVNAGRRASRAGNELQPGSSWWFARSSEVSPSESLTISHSYCVIVFPSHQGPLIVGSCHCSPPCSPHCSPHCTLTAALTAALTTTCGVCVCGDTEVAGFVGWWQLRLQPGDLKLIITYEGKDDGDSGSDGSGTDWKSAARTHASCGLSARSPHECPLWHLSRGWARGRIICCSSILTHNYYYLSVRNAGSGGDRCRSSCGSRIRP